MTCQPINRVTAKAGSYTSQTVFIYIRLFSYVVDGTQVVVHAVTSVVCTDIFQPFHTESRQTATVGSNDDIVVCCHELQIPAIAPELADRTLWTSLAEKKSRILLVRVEISRINYPWKHIFSIDSLGPACFYFTHLQLTEYLIVFFCDAGYCIFLFQIDSEQFVCLA